MTCWFGVIIQRQAGVQSDWCAGGRTFLWLHQLSVTRPGTIAGVIGSRHFLFIHQRATNVCVNACLQCNSTPRCINTCRLVVCISVFLARDAFVRCAFWSYGARKCGFKFMVGYSPLFWAPGDQSMFTYSQSSFSISSWKRGGAWMCKLGVISRKRLKIEVKLLLSANKKSYMPRRLATTDALE